MKKLLFFILLVSLCGCSFAIKESNITNDNFYQSCTIDLHTKEDVVNEMKTISKRMWKYDQWHLFITTKMVTASLKDEKKIFYWKDLEPRSNDSFNEIIRMRIGYRVVYAIGLNTKETDNDFAFIFLTKTDAEIMQALLFKMAELQNSSSKPINTSIESVKTWSYPVKTNNTLLVESDDDIIIDKPENEFIGGIVGKYKIILKNSIFGFEAGEYDEGEITIVNIATKEEYFAFSENGYYYCLNLPSGNYVFLNHKMLKNNGGWLRHGSKYFKSTDEISKELIFHVKEKELTLIDNIEVSAKWNTKSKKR